MIFCYYVLAVVTLTAIQCFAISCPKEFHVVFQPHLHGFYKNLNLHLKNENQTICVYTQKRFGGLMVGVKTRDALGEYILWHGNFLHEHQYYGLEKSGSAATAELKLQDVNCIFKIRREEDPDETVIKLFEKAWRRQLITEELLSFFAENSYENKLITSTLEELNVFPNLLTEHIDDGDDELPAAQNLDDANDDIFFNKFDDDEDDDDYEDLYDYNSEVVDENSRGNNNINNDDVKVRQMIEDITARFSSTE
ncbi:hypothetical protein HELRODRAFT_177644 [Helobdella robusta]|uniref:Uncharacterized protein n=1 Tax=Helobdella robusta TaxID=6412 RepID=T1FC00_HELRO|nr:hypothetical protein HELRODRAFT_177644 [Helobdella robusta]ESN97973.1 hypothetical protein HELRODRAFT_177644 [Helobdella robusta]